MAALLIPGHSQTIPDQDYSTADLEDNFIKPSPEYGTDCWWWWLNGNVTREAITSDLEAMKEKGFHGAMIFDAGGHNQRGNRDIPAGPLFASEEWITSDNILGAWDNYLVRLKNARIARDRVRAYLTPESYKLLKQAAGISRFVDISGGGERSVDRNIGGLDGVKIIETPADLMMSAYDFTEGWNATVSAKQINMLFVDPMAVAAPVVYETSMMSPPSAQSKGKYIYYERYYYDVFVLNNRKSGILANVEA